VITLSGPTHSGFCGGDEANVSPANGQLIRQAVAVILVGGKPESNIGDGKTPEAGLS